MRNKNIFKSLEVITIQDSENIFEARLEKNDTFWYKINFYINGEVVKPFSSYDEESATFKWQQIKFIANK